MKKTIFTMPLVLAAALVLLFLAGCDDNEGGYAKPDIVTVSPVSGVRGSTITLTGANLKNVKHVRFGLVDAADFDPAANTETSLTFKVPPGAPAGDNAVVVYFDGAENSLGASARTTFAVLVPPYLHEVSVEEALPNAQVKIYGYNLQSTSSVKFGDLETLDFKTTDGTLTVKVPEDSPLGDISVTVTSPGGSAGIPFHVITPPTLIKSFAPAVAQPGDEITVTGVQFVDVQAVKIGDTDVPGFSVVNSKTITFEVPANAGSGKISVVTNLGTFISEEKLTIPVEFLLKIFDDALNASWAKWGGWGTDLQDMENTEFPQNGAKAIKLTFSDGYGGFQLHPDAPSPFALSEYTSIKMSVRGGALSDGKQISIYIKNGAGVESGKAQLTLVEGAYTTYIIPLSDLGNPSDISELIIQNWGTSGISFYIDDWGLN